MKLYLLYTYTTSIDMPTEFIGVFKTTNGILRYVTEVTPVIKNRTFTVTIDDTNVIVTYYRKTKEVCSRYKYTFKVIDTDYLY